MWFLNIYNHLFLFHMNPTTPSLIFYNDVFYYILSLRVYKKWHKFLFTSQNSFIKRLFILTFETKTVRFKYVGKSYRVSKKKRILFLLLHYPTFNYLIWRNIKLKHKRKKKKSFKFKFLTSNNIKVQLFMNLFKLRIPNTYTKRGLYNNIFTYYNRKRKLSTHR